MLGDCLALMKALPNNCVDLVMTSPPYVDARNYGIGFTIKGQAWVDWAVERYLECVRICRGAVVWVVEGKTRNYQWDATPALLMADLHRAGAKLRKPPAFQRVGIPGSGGPDWFRNDYEFCIASSKGKLVGCDNTAMGKPPKYGPGGAPSHRTKTGARINAKRTPSQKERSNGRDGNGSYKPPKLANPGNIIHCKVGGGAMGSPLAHDNEAPFPERLAEFFIRSCCPPGGIVLDPFVGSGTVPAVAIRAGRRWMGMECRESQIELTRRRIKEVQQEFAV